MYNVQKGSHGPRPSSQGLVAAECPEALLMLSTVRLQEWLERAVFLDVGPCVYQAPWKSCWD